MSTNSTISIQHEDGTVKSIYCQWDGDVDWNGKILQQHYTDPAKIDQLMELGDLSSLGEEIGTKHDFDDYNKGECTAYGRDRGQTDVAAETFADFEEFKAEGDFQQYNYLFRNGAWEVSRNYGNTFKSLQEALAA